MTTQPTSERPALDEARLRAEARQERTRLREQMAAETEKIQRDLRNATDAKISRLRELRLAREAEDKRVAADQAAVQAANPPPPKRSHKARPKPDSRMESGAEL